MLLAPRRACSASQLLCLCWIQGLRANQLSTCAQVVCCFACAEVTVCVPLGTLARLRSSFGSDSKPACRSIGSQ